MKNRPGSKRLSPLVLFLLCLAPLAACQPTPEERLERASAFAGEGDYRAAVVELKNALRRDPENVDARLLLAKSSAQLGDLPTATAEYERVLGLGNTDEAVWLGLARILLDQGRASEIVERVLPNLDEQNPSVDSMLLQGDVLTVLGNFDGAASWYSSVLEAEANNDRALVGMAVVAAGRGDADSAYDFVKRATESKPDSAFAWRALANFERTKHDYAAAAAAFGESARRETVHTSVTDKLTTRVGHIGVLLDSRQHEEAEPILDELAKIAPGHPMLKYLRGRLAYIAGDYDAAGTYLRDYLSLVPNDLRGHAVLGAVNFSQNYYRQAEMYLRQAASQNVGGEQTRRMLAETQLRLNKPEDALVSLTGVDSGAQDDPILLMMLGRAQLGLGNFDEAIDFLEQGAIADPDNPATQLSLAAGLIVSGDFSRAVEVLESLPETDDETFKRETLLIAAHLRGGDQESAIAVSQTLLDENSESAVAHVIAGSLRQSIGDNAEAGALYQQAADLDANNIRALYGLGYLALTGGDNEKAEAYFLQALDVDAAYMPALIKVAQLFAEKSRFDELQPRIEAATQANPESHVPQLVNARAAIAMRRYADALEIVRSAGESHTDVPLLDHAEGLALINTGQGELGLRKLATAAANAPEVAAVHLDLARYRLQAGDFDGAASAIERYREMRPNRLAGLYTHCQALALAGRADEARQELAGFRASYGESVDLTVLEGDIELNAGQPAEAVRFYSLAAEQLWSRAVVLRLVRASQAAASDDGEQALMRWLDENPEDLELRRYYALILEARGETEAAAGQYERVLEQSADDAVALNNLAWTYSEEGRPGAVELAERAHELLPNNGSISDTLGWVLYKDGQLERAEEMLRQAARQSPNNPEVRFHLAVVLAKTGQGDEAKTLLAELLDGDAQFTSRDEAEELANSL